MWAMPHKNSNLSMLNFPLIFATTCCIGKVSKIKQDTSSYEGNFLGPMISDIRNIYLKKFPLSDSLDWYFRFRHSFCVQHPLKYTLFFRWPPKKLVNFRFPQSRKTPLKDKNMWRLETIQERLKRKIKLIWYQRHFFN